ncbi:MAG: PAS domain S-box protein [Planctomycetes bacterium]|nr:PAS domain S-box protein [Planctomycetota bacterium]
MTMGRETFNYLTVSAYWLVVFIWILVVVLFIRYYRRLRPQKPVLGFEVIVLLVVGLGVVFENLYYAAAYTTLVGDLPPSLLTEFFPGLLIGIPKMLILVAGFIVFWLMLKRRSQEIHAESIHEIQRLRRFSEDIVATIPASVLVLDYGLRVVSANRGYHVEWRRGQESAAGKELREALPLLLLTDGGLLRAIEETKSSQRPCDLTEVRHTRPDGQERLFDVHVQHMTPAHEGDQPKILLLLTDVTERGRLQRLIRESEAQYRSIVTGVRDLIFTQDAEGRLTFVNEQCRAQLGYTPGEMTGRRLQEFIHEEDRARWAEAFQKVVQEQMQVEHVEVRVRHRDGSWRYFSANGSPIKSRQGASAGVFGVARDTTTYRQLQEQLVQAEKLSAIGALVSGVAHELNNPLTGVIGYSDLLLGSECSDEMKSALTKISREAGRCRRIVQNLLVFARKKKPERANVSVNDILEATLDLRAYQLRVDNIEVVTELDRRLPRTWADFQAFQQVFLNVINNAHDAMMGRETERRLVIRTRHHAAENAIHVQFQDNGHGITPENLRKIFDPFFTTKAVGEGTGLGLSISYGIVKEHDGDIRVESEPGHGATVTVVLPVKPEPAAVDAEARAHEPGAAHRGRRILVVDDEDVILDFLSTVLKGDGYWPDTARSAEDALQKLSATAYDLLITDLKMPGMSGGDLYSHVRARWPQLAQRVVFISGDTMSPSTQAFRAMLGVRFLEKPFNVDELKRMVRDMLQEPEAAAPAHAPDGGPV